MKRLLLWLFVLLIGCEEQTKDQEQNFVTPFETSKGNETATYPEAISFYKELARDYPEINIQTIGATDSGNPLHVVTFNTEADFNFQKIAETKTIILINNGIHPGESDGIDASMLLFRDLAQEVLDSPENVVVVTIPIYNVGGALNRGAKTRANQNGPVSYGFRGNARNYDLNRDFIKCDTENTRTFARIYQLIQPDFLVDCHVSNGADYQYTISHLLTQHNKLGGEPGVFIEQKIIPDLERLMEDSGWPVTPFVNIYNKPPDEGFSQFMDHPRYSTGYAALWNTFGLMIETHMLKPYHERVTATYELLRNTIKFCESEHDQIKSIRESARSRHLRWTYYPLNWQLDSTKTRQLQFKGYQADTLISEVTGFDRLKYNKGIPYTKEIPYFNEYKAVDSVRIPQAYIIGKEWSNVAELLDINDISYTLLDKDTVIRVESYRIEDYQTLNYPYEGHYPHYNTKVSGRMIEGGFSEGDYFIPTRQAGIRYLLETLEPEAVDSFFNWNFFDSVLQQKEGFSPYVFEELALEILRSNWAIKDSFELKKSNDPEFERNRFAQLQWIYERSEYYEASHMQYPVYRVLESVEVE
ncbi:MAG: M14 family metallopeptidase [Flavobacteriaceae bacterium]